MLGYLYGMRSALLSGSGSRQPGPLAVLVALAAVAVLIARWTGGGSDRGWS